MTFSDFRSEIERRLSLLERGTASQHEHLAQVWDFYSWAGELTNEAFDEEYGMHRPQVSTESSLRAPK